MVPASPHTLPHAPVLELTPPSLQAEQQQGAAADAMLHPQGRDGVDAALLEASVAEGVRSSVRSALKRARAEPPHGQSDQQQRSAWGPGVGNSTGGAGGGGGGGPGPPAWVRDDALLERELEAFLREEGDGALDEVRCCT